MRGRLAEQRREVRNVQARPLLESLKQWLEETLGKLSRKSDTAMAVRYALPRSSAFLSYVAHSRIQIHNNPRERPLRPAPLGLQNYLFAPSQSRRPRPAATY